MGKVVFVKVEGVMVLLGDNQYQLLLDKYDAVPYKSDSLIELRILCHLKHVQYTGYIN